MNYKYLTFSVIVGFLVFGIVNAELIGGTLYWTSNNFGIGTSTPIAPLSVVGNAVITGTITSENLTVLRGFATSTATSASDSSNKILTAWCPTGYNATGGGGQVTAGNADDVTINMSFPTATTSGWTTEFRESDAIAGNWTAVAHVVCTKK